MSTSKPTIVFVGGAWHPPQMYAPFLTAMESAGYSVLAPHHPSIGDKIGTFDDDVSQIAKAITDEADQGKEVVVIMHSYGGMVGSASVKGLLKSERSNGGVIKIVYVTAYVIEEGASLFDMGDGTPPPYLVRVNEKQWAVSDTNAMFYNDIDDSTAAELESQLEHHSHAAFVAKQTYAPWKHIDSAYIICDLDNVVPKPAQEFFANQPGNRFTFVEHMSSGHTPFVSKPQETADLVRKAIGEQL